jgi:hypothetical protein
MMITSAQWHHGWHPDGIHAKLLSDLTDASMTGFGQRDSCARYLQCCLCNAISEPTYCTQVREAGPIIFCDFASVNSKAETLADTLAQNSGWQESLRGGDTLYLNGHEWRRMLGLFPRLTLIAVIGRNFLLSKPL